MHRRDFMQRAGWTAAAGAGWLGPGSGAGSSVLAEEPAAKQLNDVLQKVRTEHDLPGIAAAVVRDGRIVAEAVAGVRQVGADERIIPQDRFLIGSCTKRMTAAMVGRVIDMGKLAFDTTLAEVLPDIDMREDYRKVTIAQLLTFTGGIRPYMQISPELTPILFELKGPAMAQRKGFVRHVLQEEPVATPGTTRTYSNASYVVAAFAASRRTDRLWEQLMQDEIFKPLEMMRSGFGRPWSKERPNEPRRHIKRDDRYHPEPEGAEAVAGDEVGGRLIDASEAMAGPGGVHCSISDFAKFAAYELAAARGNDPLLKPATAKRWQELSRGGGEGRPVRGGTPWVTAAYVLWPSRNMAAAAMVNGGTAFEACRAVFDAVEKK